LAVAEQEDGVTQQKYPRFSLVRVHAPGRIVFGDCWGIVEGTYSQLYGGRDVRSYSLFILGDDRKTAVNRSSWYEEGDLTLSSEPLSLESAVEITDAYLARRYATT
jgi:hypothetical protein